MIEIPLANLIAGSFVCFAGGFITAMVFEELKKEKKRW